MTSLKNWQLFLLVVYCLPKSSEQSSTLEDLKQKNCSYHRQSTCEEPTLSCQCDDACIDYGDCCLQTRLYNRDQMVNSISKYECISVPSENKIVYMVGKCKSSWKNNRVDNLCQKGSYKTSYENQTREFPILDTPFTSLITNVTYKNYYCAVCNEESLSKIVAWSLRMICYFDSAEECSSYDPSDLLDEIEVNNGTYGVNIYITDEELTFRKCRLESVIPGNLTVRFHTYKSYVSTCLSTWTNLEIQNLCHSYTLLVHHQNVTYRNYHCAMCNFVKGNSGCDLSLPEEGHKSPKFIQTHNYTIPYKICPDGQIIDPNSSECVYISISEALTSAVPTFHPYYSRKLILHWMLAVLISIVYVSVME